MALNAAVEAAAGEQGRGAVVLEEQGYVDVSGRISALCLQNPAVAVRIMVFFPSTVYLDSMDFAISFQ